MKKHIHRYLETSFYFKKGKLFAYRDDCLTNMKNLTKELEKVFELKQKQLKWYIKSWFKKHNKDFESYWSMRNFWFDFFMYDIAFPKMRNVLPQMSFMERLTRVEPMKTPIMIMDHLSLIRPEGENSFRRRVQFELPVQMPKTPLFLQNMYEKIDIPIP